MVIIYCLLKRKKEKNKGITKNGKTSGIHTTHPQLVHLFIFFSEVFPIFGTATLASAWTVSMEIC